MVTVLQKLEMEGQFLNIIKVIYDKLTANIPSRETQRILRPKSGMKPRWPLFELVFNIVF